MEEREAEKKEGMREGRDEEIEDGDNEVKLAPTPTHIPTPTPTPITNTSQYSMTAHICVCPYVRTLASLLASSSCSGLII